MSRSAPFRSRLAVPPIPAELPRGRGADAGPRRDRLLRDDPAVVCQVRAGIRHCHP